jgi:hypothetical protein
MTLGPPSIPNYETPVLEQELDPGKQGFRFNIAWYQFLSLMRMAMITQPQAAIGSSLAGAAELNTDNGIITTEPLTTPAGTVYTLTVQNSSVFDYSNVTVNVSNGTNTGGAALLQSIEVDDGVMVINILNIGATAFNGSLQINFLVN